LALRRWSRVLAASWSRTADQLASSIRARRPDGTRPRFAQDSPLEGNGFELPVPREISSGFEASAELRPIEPSQRLYWFAEAVDCSDNTAVPIEEPPLTVE
jgi:hypothetical protein